MSSPVPVSMFLAGIAVQLDVDLTLIGAGVGMATVALIGVASKAVRNIGLEPALAEAEVAAAADSAANGAPGPVHAPA